MITVCGKRVGKDVDFPESIGIIIETPGFLPYQSGYRNLKTLAALKGKIGKKEIMEALCQVGLLENRRKAVARYSLGMRQRLGLVQAIMENPQVLVLDEPFNGLDQQGVKEARKLLWAQKNQGKAILLASHNAEDIRELCDEVFPMEV